MEVFAAVVYIPVLKSPKFSFIHSGQFWHNTVSHFMVQLREAVKTAMCENSLSTSKAYLLVFVICRVNTSCNTVNWTPLEVAEAGRKAIAMAVSCVCLCECVCLCVCLFK